jgi:hypothetical protein
MSSSDLETEQQLSNSPIGKMFLFHRPDFQDGHPLSMSSQISQLGIVFDRTIKNKSLVMVLSDPEMAKHPAVGDVGVCKCFYGGMDMWLPVEHLFPIEE